MVTPGLTPDLEAALTATAEQLSENMPEEHRVAFVRGYVANLGKLNQQITAAMEDLGQELTEVALQYTREPTVVMDHADHVVKEVKKIVIDLVNLCCNLPPGEAHSIAKAFRRCLKGGEAAQRRMARDQTRISDGLS